MCSALPRRLLHAQPQLVPQRSPVHHRSRQPWQLLPRRHQLVPELRGRNPKSQPCRLVPALRKAHPRCPAALRLVGTIARYQHAIVGIVLPGWWRVKRTTLMQLQRCLVVCVSSAAAATVVLHLSPPSTAGSSPSLNEPSSGSAPAAAGGRGFGTWDEITNFVRNGGACLGFRLLCSRLTAQAAAGKLLRKKRGWMSSSSSMCHFVIRESSGTAFGVHTREPHRHNRSAVCCGWVQVRLPPLHSCLYGRTARTSST